VRILIADDDGAIRESLERVLQIEGYDTGTVANGLAVLDEVGKAGGDPLDLLILDVMMPRLGGLETCRRLRAAGRDLPVLMLTARDQVSDRVAGLDAGADDYLPKPFALRELTARVAALGRRSRPAVPPVLRRAGITLDPHRREVYRDGRYVPLSRKEFAVLAELLRADGTAVSAEQLLEKAWDENADPFTHAVRMTILKLRRKLGDPPVLLTEPGVGYRIP